MAVNVNETEKLQEDQITEKEDTKESKITIDEKNDETLEEKEKIGEDSNSDEASEKEVETDEESPIIPESEESKPEKAPDNDTIDEEQNSEPETADETEDDTETKESVYEREIAMYEKTMESVKVGNIVDGKIIKVDSNEVYVDIGFKAEGVIPLHAFREEIAVGDTISVYIVSKENKAGRPRLSKKKADIKKTWDELEEMQKENSSLTVQVVKRVKGGLITNYNGVQGFLPASQVALKTLPNLDHLINKDLEVKIINIERPKNNLVYSRKIVLQKDIKKQKDKLIKKLADNSEVDGVVKNIMDYGVFVDLGGMDGLVHISDMSWGHIDHPSEMLSIGDKVKVRVLSFDKDKEKISLGLKQLVPHPWKNIQIKYPEGSKIKGKVTNLANFGAFVELEKGVEGLIHISEMSWTKKISHPKQILQLGSEVEAIVLDIDKGEHRISLGLKQIEPNPWLTINVLHPVGSKVSGKIKNITEFGAFMEVEDDIDGLIHVSDLSWTKRIMHPKELLKVGQEVTAVILSIDNVMQRIALGLKQLEDDPWIIVEEKMPLNSEHNVKIDKIINKGAIVITKDNIEGFIPASHLGIPGLQDPKLAFSKDDELPVKVIEVDQGNRRLILSVKTYYFGREEDEINEYVKKHLKKIKTSRKERAKEHHKDTAEKEDA